MLVSVNALTSIYSRIPHAMSSDRLLPPALRKVNSRGTPVPSLCLSVLMTLAFILSNTFDSALALLAFFMIFNYALAFVGISGSDGRNPTRHGRSACLATRLFPHSPFLVRRRSWPQPSGAIRHAARPPSHWLPSASRWHDWRNAAPR